LAGNSERAKVGYTAVRRRFSGSESAANAAFHLGQLAFDGARDYRAARRFFATYLNECRSCNWSAEALGRRMEAEQRSGTVDLARASARLYLERYPNGAHARLAESLKDP
jgi:TolA-binding protein